MSDSFIQRACVRVPHVTARKILPREVGIRGAGLSGMSVARELLRLDPSLRITIYDTRSRLPHPQRTFCFFENETVSRREMRAFSWNTVMFRGLHFERRIDVSNRPYTMIRGDDFFEHTLRGLEQQGVRFVWECGGVRVRDACLETEHETRTFDVVIDAAFEAMRSSSIMWQSFAGIWVTTESDMFDPSTATLMDLHASSAEVPVGFMYILPTSTRTALIEHTTFSPTPLSKEYHIERCLEWIREQAPSEARLGESEYGVIPMGLRMRSRDGQCIVGSAAGAVRAATGYAFVAVQQQAREVALHVVAGDTKPLTTYPRWLEATDTIFLQALLRAPERGGEIMSQLLSRAQGERLISFLSGTCSFMDALSVWLSVPKRIMLRALAGL